MKRLFISTLLLLVVNVLILSISISSASAHGVGGIEPSRTKAAVDSVVPESDLFNAESIENGDRFKVTRTSNQDVIVLGVDDEPYILINESGSFTNNKSATGLINKSTMSDYSKVISNSDFENTSIDPNQIPDWKKVSGSQSYAWHDHRTHYMGSIPSGVTDLGSSSLKIKAGEDIHVVNLKFVASETKIGYEILWITSALIVGLIIFSIWKKNLFIKISTRSIVLSLLSAILILESVHIWGYIVFSQRSLFEELTSTMYSIALVCLSGISISQISRRTPAATNWRQVLAKQAPLISLTAFIGIFVGGVFEYKTFTNPYIPTIYSASISQVLIATIALCSTCLLTIGIGNLSTSKNSEAPLKVSQD